MLSDARLLEVAGRLVEVPGVRAVVLGGSRARGDHTAESDVDLGLYYRPPLDVDALGAAVRDLAGPEARVSAPGEWGPWVDGGGWLRVDGTAVDVIYRDLERVRRSWQDAQEGRFAWHAQAGHPLGVPSFAYAGEIALAVVLADPSGEVTALHEEAAAYPPALRDAVVGGLWEAAFSLDVAAKAVGRGDAAYVAGCLFRAVLLCAHALHAHAGRWVTNEKGAVAAAGRLPGAPRDLGERAQALCAAVGVKPDALRATLAAAHVLVDETVAACGEAS
ncbi:nucleotidyltransferase domain-containing protein [Cellulomonas fimi]|uniref:nucleotidyltransferase family protein n=1 Tax=Cellulomonas fimi TaxID=1708 RepID=UPI00234DB480|nr:nucleotidyltransferase domain-containing protein [Cellulomonas fimi]MDC7120432.1 nucleotidyltransferase domain-containing protein [Cellulomonas fimi]